MRRGVVWAALIVALLVAAVFLAWRVGLFALLSRREELQALVASLGAWGPLAIVALEVLQVLLAPLPGQLTSIVAGYLYGVWWGSALCMAGLVLGTALAMALARRYGRPLVERLASREALARIDRAVERRGAAVFLLIFLVPFLPDDVAAFVAGLSSLRLARLLLVATVGRAPGVVFAAFLGARAGELAPLEIALLVLASLVLLALFWRYRAPLERAMFRLVDRLSGREGADT